MTGEEGVRRVAERLVESIEGQEWLDKPGYRLEHGMAFAFNLLGERSERVRDFLHGTWLGDPLHPVLTNLPIDDHLARTLRTDPASPRFAAELAALTAAIEGHAGEEEREMFPQSHALGDERLDLLGEKMIARQQQLRRSKLTRLGITIKREILRRT